jgi:replication fork clamp-binding protein CrfC
VEGELLSKNHQDDPVAKALEQAVNRLAVAEETNRLLEDRLAAKDSRIMNLMGVIAVRDEQLKLAQESRTDLGTVASIDQVRIEACQQQLAKADAEIHRLRHPGFLKSIFDPKVITSAMGGYLVGRSSQ